ncbi:hypothetical protein SAMN04488024_11014 [Pedobacter soli]|uniref:Uncharacterized protein n=2 Tax=Pedobacter soli TaxID=390242 RepID=A0A1G6ZA83_9SPHI|nr:hypothetical protein SAMN04488024_11014 [Pedobacter soli]
MLTLLFGCTGKPQETVQTEEKPQSPAVASKHPDAPKPRYEKGLLYENQNFSSYIDEVKRGAGVISFTLEVNDRLDIWNLDDTKFGEIVMNEDLTYFTLNLPKKVIARKLIPENDFAAFEFDAEKPEPDAKYLFIYVNREKRKVEKKGTHFAFTAWK